MAKAPAKPKTSKGGPGKGKAAKRGAGARALSLLVAIVLVVLFFDSVIVLAAGMIPTGVAYLVDRTYRKYAARSVGWINLAGCLIVILDLWGGGGTIGLALELLGDPLNWLIMFGAAGIGWAVYFGMTPVVAGYLALKHDMKLKELAKRQKTLEKEWGTDVRKSAALDELEMVEEEIAAQARADAARRKPGAQTGAANSESGNGDGDGDDDQDDISDDPGDLSDTPAGRPIPGRNAPGS